MLMKKLLDLLNAIPQEDRDSFAHRCSTSFDYLRQIGYGNRACRESLAINIEREMRGAITCEELCPEADWGYIRASRSAKHCPDLIPGTPIDGATVRAAKGGIRKVLTDTRKVRE